jgi:frataxin
MNPTEFESLADALLSQLFDAIEAASSDRAEVDLEGGVLTLEVEGTGTWVLNKHAPMQQLWLSSPRSGAHHFAREEGHGRWLSTRGGGELMALLKAELEAALGGPVAI